VPEAQAQPGLFPKACDFVGSSPQTPNTLWGIPTNTTAESETQDTGLVQQDLFISTHHPDSLHDQMIVSNAR